MSSSALFYFREEIIKNIVTISYISRLTDSTEHDGQMEKMLSMLVELQNTERAMGQKLSETENEALSLNRRVEKLEHIVKERICSPLSQNKHCETVWVSCGSWIRTILNGFLNIWPIVYNDFLFIGRQWKTRSMKNTAKEFSKNKSNVYF